MIEIYADTKIAIDENFKVEAGPGAGKTLFLVNHIKNVLASSGKLSKLKKIACITYTNTGCKVIQERLGKESFSKVEVSTIHSFLYRNVVKPYLSFISEKWGVDVSKVDGHDEVNVSFSKMQQWLKHDEFSKLSKPSRKQILARLDPFYTNMLDFLNSLQCVIECDEIVFRSKKDRINKDNRNIFYQKIFTLKKLYWQNGILAHEDVLFFSAQLIKDYPFILHILKAKYPYIFIDEYQDTNPIQADIVEKLKELGVIVGVIGDKAQAIYGFQGADCSLFDSFRVNDNRKYFISANNRSNRNLVAFYNKIRKDLSQNCIREDVGSKIEILVGDKNKVYQKVKAENIDAVLARKNMIVDSISNEMYFGSGKKNINELKQNDSTKNRYKSVLSYIEALELANCNDFKQAIKIMNKAFPHNDKKVLLKHLMILSDNHEIIKEKTLYFFYDFINREFSLSLPAFREGKGPFVFYNDKSYNEIAINYSNVDFHSNIMTIHQSKGAEFNNVLIVTEKNKNDLLNLLLSFSLDSEECRIYYVAMTRSKDKLFLQLDELSHENEEKLKNIYGDLIDIVYIE